MFELEYIEDKEEAYYYLFHSETELGARIFPGSGASLQHLSYGGIPLIGLPEAWHYQSSYASSFLFPFANRVNSGTYRFEGKDYQLSSNDPINGHAIHGFIYNKYFELVSHDFYRDEARLNFSYSYNGDEEGFPFSFDICITYTFRGGNVQIDFKLDNTSELDFPFSLGWHPYFLSSRIEDVRLEFKSKKLFLMSDSGRYIGEEAFDASAFSLEKTWDHCFQLEDAGIRLLTSDYDVRLVSSNYKPYMQLFTPLGKSCIALEPVSAPLDSFNNQIGLMVLHSGSSREFTWALEICKR